MIHVLELDISSQEPPAPMPHGDLWILARWGDRVLGDFSVDGSDAARTDLRELALRLLTAEAFYAAHAMPVIQGPHVAQDLTIVIDVAGESSESIEACLRAVAALDPQPGEVLVKDGDGRAVGDTARLERRNRALAESHGSLVAFLTPRCLPDPRFTSAVIRGFSVGSPGAILPLVTPAELVTESQVAFHTRFLPHRRYERKSWLGSDDFAFSPLLVHPAVIGAVSYDRAALDRLGGFPTGPGITVRQSEYEVLAGLHANDRTIGYQPDLVIRHLHPRTRAEGLAWLDALAFDRAQYRRQHHIPVTGEHGRRIASVTRSLRLLARGDLDIRRRLTSVSATARATVTGARR